MYNYRKPLTEEQIAKAADYWTSRVNGLVPNQGDRAELGKDAGIANLWAGMLFKKPTLEQLSAFHLGLKDVLSRTTCWERYLFNGYCLSVDYDPCYLLREVAKEAGVCENNFPWKTRMYFHEDGKVMVCDGYGADEKEI